jgi:poly-gamma-glutamate capsule biosynthesis protein CapA/YwtB (metallophosphatase superfamily)
MHEGELMKVPAPSLLRLRRACIAACWFLFAVVLFAGTVVPAQAQDATSTISITLAGDVGFNPNKQRVHPKGVYDNGFQTWVETTLSIADEVDGDLNFLNVESVVTDRNDLRPDLKGQRGPFNFRMHPNGLKHLTSIGFNVLSLANNHSMDYGPKGLAETVRHVDDLRGNGVVAAAGIGANRDAASKPELITVKGETIAFSAMGIVTNNLARHRAGKNKPGQIAYRFDDDFAEVRRRLVATPAALRILSIHYGVEGRVRADGRQIKDWRRTAAAADGIDLIVGHHAHVVRGVEMHGKSLIFYGLGNFLHHGTTNMTAKGICRDYGLFARVHLSKNIETGKFEVVAVEAMPVTDTHMKTRRLKGAKGIARVHALNYLAATLDNKKDGARGLRFTPQKDGSGLFCVPGAEQIAGRVGTLCKRFKPAPPVPSSLRRRIASSCRR